MELTIKRTKGWGYLLDTSSRIINISNNIVFYDGKQEISMSLELEFGMSMVLGIQKLDGYELQTHRIKKDYGKPYLLQQKGYDPILYIPLSMVEARTEKGRTFNTVDMIYHYKNISVKCSILSEGQPVQYLTYDKSWWYKDGLYSVEVIDKVTETKSYKERKKLHDEIKQVCGFDMSDYFLKVLLEEYDITRKQK